MKSPDEPDTRERDYKPHQFPVLPQTFDPAKDRDLLLALYKEVCASWRTLLDIRFKLLAIVPTVSFVLVGGLLSPTGWFSTLHPWFQLVLAILGFIATTSLFLYELRNSELYTDLGSRARRIESELGVHTGQYLGRLTRQSRWVDHKFALHLVYLSALLVWLLAAASLLRTFLGFAANVA